MNDVSPKTMKRQTSIQPDTETRRQIAQIALWWGLSSERNITAVISRMAQTTYMIEAARRLMTDSEFLGFLAEVYRPLGGSNENEI